MSSSCSSSNENDFASTTTNKDDHEDDQNSLPKVIVETVEKGFLIKVSSERSCPGLLVFILEAFEELGLEVVDARVSCTDYFHLQAIGEECEGSLHGLDAQGVRQALLQAITRWSGNI